MKRLPLILGMLVVTALACAAEPSAFSQANAKYLAGDFRVAAELYRKLVDSGAATGAVYYNLGNTSLRLGQKGEAMLYYRRAQKVRPRDGDLRWNIQVLKNALPDRIEERDPNPLYTPLKKLSHLFTPNEAALALSGALAMLALLALIRLIFPGAGGILSFFRSLALFVMLSAGLLVLLEWHEHRDPWAVVLDRETTAYYGPSERETKAFTLHAGAEGRIIDDSGDWVYLSLKNGTTGWIRKNACEVV